MPRTEHIARHKLFFGQPPDGLTMFYDCTFYPMSDDGVQMSGDGPVTFKRCVFLAPAPLRLHCCEKLPLHCRN